ncbi:MAG: hypothetical protein KatS3mg124_0762 [Porticoccaceae bacterium]|nr:MAG: hypothetical protein KatS3mg124_0762 [Porticoccaceae bacterium]
MTYCVGIQVAEGLLMMADTRTNAGIDRIATFPKLHAFVQPGERVVFVASAGNLGTAQRVVFLLGRQIAADEPDGIHRCPTLFDVAERVGDLLARTVRRYREANPDSTVNFACDLLLAGQIAGGEPALYQIYPEGNFIAATPDTPYLQIGESKYGKPILDRIIRPDTPLTQAVKCALISFDSTMQSNLSVGMPLDMVAYRKDSLEVRIERIAADDPYMRKLQKAWGGGLRSLFAQLP